MSEVRFALKTYLGWPRWFIRSLEGAKIASCSLQLTHGSPSNQFLLQPQRANSSQCKDSRLPFITPGFS